LIQAGRPPHGGDDERRRPAGSVFFFQAEDGIRDYKVTGVQTCALPICQTASSSYKPAVLSNGVRTGVPPHITVGTRIVVMTEDRSEERRVGKECRSAGGGRD